MWIEIHVVLWGRVELHLMRISRLACSIEILPEVFFSMTQIELRKVQKNESLDDFCRFSIFINTYLYGNIRFFPRFYEPIIIGIGNHSIILQKSIIHRSLIGRTLLQLFQIYFNYSSSVTMLKASAILLALIVTPQQAAGLMRHMAEKAPSTSFFSKDIGSLSTHEIQKELNLRSISYQDCYKNEASLQGVVDLRDFPTTPPVVVEQEDNEELEELRAMSIRDLREECNKRLIRWGKFRDQEELVQAIWKDMLGKLTFSASGAIHPGTVAELTGEQLDQEVAHAGILLLDVFAPWCGPCKIMLPHLEAAAAELNGKCRVAKIDCEEYPEWAAKYKIRGLPTVLVIKQGMVIDRLEGAFAKEKIVQVVQPHV